jgi:large subunit ribosomal protein L9
MDIEDALKQKGYEVDRRKIILKTPIKELGDYVVPVKLHRDVTLELPIVVSVEGEVIQEHLEEPEPEEVEESAPDTASEADETAENEVTGAGE